MPAAPACLEPPSNMLTRLLIALSQVLERAVDDLSELCRRNKRSLDAAQRALLPVELANQVC